MREYAFPLHALGSDAPTSIAIPDLAAWIATIRGTEVDLISYQTDSLLKAQIPFAAMPAAGGQFYTPRLLDAFGIADTSLTNAPELQTSALETDIRIARTSAKTFRFSLPSPQSLNLTDEYYQDYDEFMDAITASYVDLGRFMRDAGVFGCILLGDLPCELELERLHGKHYLWSTPASALESVLELTRDIVVSKDEIACIANLMDSYTIRDVYIKDADATCLKIALEMIDSDHLFTAGYANTTNDYWETLSALKVRVSDKEY